MTSSLIKANGGNRMFCRNSQVLWRSNDDETALLLNGTTGNAYLLSPAVVKIWLALENGLPESELNKSGLMDDKSFAKTINGLLDKGLVLLIDEESHIVRSDGSESCNLLQNLTGPYTIDEIAFGGCDCDDNTGNRYGMRQIQCNEASILRDDVSIV